ncbi:MAG: LPS export ABC transporter periplasmic protein LptC [Gammaproteobacteria bacterium]|nr:LPS export ABC transporter periplasmic protein LptC [Gammaproteobacteria bacterium]
MMRQLSIFVFLLLLTTISWWSLSLIRPDENKPSVSREGPDFFMEKFVSTEMNENGVPLRRLAAQQLTHYANDDRSELVRPLVTIFKEKRSLWQVSAQQGTVLQAGDEITMFGNVKIIKPAATGSMFGELMRESAPGGYGEPPTAALTIDTQHLRIYVKDDYAESKGMVIIQQDGNRLTSMGMKAYFETGTIELLSQIRGKYAY